MPAVLTDDALNRYRITHPDRDLRPLLKRIHRIPLQGQTAAIDGIEEDQKIGPEVQEDAERERELTRIEVLKWKATVERLLASAGNLKRQGERYRRRAEETTQQAEALEATLEDEKRLLATKLKERDHMIRCDEVYAKVTARPKSREELEEQITLLQAQIETHRTAHASYLEIVRHRVDAFAAIAPIVDDVKGMKLPLEAFADTGDENGMDVDSAGSTSALNGDNIESGSDRRQHLSASALPFQPGSSSGQAATGSTSTRNTPAPPPTAPSSRAASHALPHRPSRKSPSIPPTAPSSGGGGRSGPSNRASSASLPQRPSGLRSSVTPGRSLLEEGEVEGEEGEVADKKTPRSGSRRR